MRLFRTFLAVLLWALATVAGAQGFVAVPPLTSPVTDQADMLAPEQERALENVLREYEARTGSQIAVLLVNTTAPEAIEQYGIRVADTWKIGRQGVDDGVILIVAKDNPPALRRLRIEAGRGVQGVLTDAMSKRILQDVIAPHFRQNDFYGGLVAGVSAITALLDKESFPAPAPGGAEASEASLWDWLPFLFFAFIVLTAFRRGRRRGLARNAWGRSPGVILGPAIGGGLGGWGSHRGYGGFGRGGGFGGGGFSGGGGTFDGGGASGNW